MQTGSNEDHPLLWLTIIIPCPRLSLYLAWGPGPGEYDPQPNNKIAGPVYYGSSSSQKCLTPTRSQQGRLGKEASPGKRATITKYIERQIWLYVFHDAI